jgi:hypothetical protein
MENSAQTTSKFSPVRYCTPHLGHLAKKVNKAEELTYHSTNIGIDPNVHVLHWARLPCWPFTPNQWPVL